MTFQPSYQNKSCSECQQDVRKIERHADRQTDGQKDRQIDSQTGRYTSVPVRQTIVTERQNDSMAE